MVAFKSLDEITLAMIDFLRLVQPDLDTKPGTVARDLFVDVPASELAKLYGELRNVANLQSLAAATGSELDRLAKNYGLTRGTGTPAQGTAVFTTNDLSTDIFIAANTLVTASNGVTFRTLVDVTMESDTSSLFASNALRIRSDLDLAGISDQFAIEVGVEATASGTAGNIGKYSLNTQTVSGISNVTNVVSFTGGSSSESDEAFRGRALGIFAGSNIGTALGYTNAVLSDSRIQDALTVEPGDPLMIRDGTDTGVDDEGNAIVISSGTGGKVDVYIQGTDTETFSESTIWRDQSGRGDPTDSANDIILGQRSINPLLDFQQRKVLSISQGTLPYQPVDRVVSISGSLSGPNFTQKFTDAGGVERGSYELIKDDGAFAGSPFGFDRIHFISDRIELDSESTSKGVFNGQDPLDFTDVQCISSVNQDFSVTNENATVNRSDRSIITLNHTPVITTTRVENLTTGERYSISNQNVDGGDTNTTGRVQISGSTLPTSNDVLQVNYLWDLEFDDELDFDNLKDTNLFTRTVQDSIDWGFANRVEEEEETVLYSVADGYHIIVEHPVSRVINVNTRTEETVTNVAGKLTVTDTVLNVFSVVDGDGQEAFNTFENNGSFSGKEITLPTDTVSLIGESATVTYNVTDIYSPDGYDTGSFSGAVIQLQDGVANAGETVYVDYVANVPTLLPTTALSSLPADGYQNNFVVNSSVSGNQPVSHQYISDVKGRTLRFSPSYLRMNVQGTSALGRLTVKGTGYRRVEELITVRKDGLDIDLTEAIQASLGITSLPSTLYVAQVAKVNKVTLSNGEVNSTDVEYDLLNYKLKNSSMSNRTALTDSSLDRFTVSLSATERNLDDHPITGEVLQVVFYVADTNTVENITVSAAGVHVSANKYSQVERVTISSGFIGLSGSLDGTISIDTLTQPIAGSTYFVTYDYTAPKEGERLVITYDFNRLINDATFLIEDVRPVTADVLVKAANTIEVDVSMNIVATSNVTITNATLRQNVEEAITSFLTDGGLGTIVDASDVISTAAAVNGVDRVVLTGFNRTGETGLVKSIVAGRDSYISAGVIEVTVEER